VEPVAGLILVGAAFAAGALNSVAGGGTFLTFPSLLLAGVPPIEANATSTVALWPGSAASAVAYREELAHERRVLLVLGAASIAGGLAGALLLIHTPQETFALLIPFLLLGATLIFAFGGRIAPRAQAAPPAAARLAAIGALQFGTAVYGGYFGAGIGFLMLASLALMGMQDIHAMNGLKVVLGMLINGVAIVAFVLAGLVVWPYALLMVAGAIAGGYGGARAAKRVPRAWVRSFVIAVGVALTAYFFLRTPLA
jgi:uncharacterized protein